MALHLKRTYNQFTDAIGLFGYNWISNFDYQLSFGSSSGFSGCYARPSIAECTTGHTYDEIFAHRPDGRIIKFTKDVATGIYWENKPDPIASLVRQADGNWLITFEDNLSELYTQGGYALWVQDEHGLRWTYTYGGMNNTQVQRVTHSNGRYVQFVWVDDELREVRDPAGTPYKFSYTNQKVAVGYQTLKTTTYPGSEPTVISYHYDGEAGEPDQSFAALTGKSYNNVRYSRFTYDTTQRAISTEHAGGVENNTFSYAIPAAGELSVTHTSPLGKNTVYDFKNGQLMTVTGQASTYCPATGRGNAYDANGYPDLVTDENGNVTNFDYNAKGQLLKKVEAQGKPEARTTVYTWDSARNRITQVTVVGHSQTLYTFTADNRLASVTATNLTANGVANQGRTTTYTYTKHANGLLATMAVDGPLPSDTVTASYSQTGDLLSLRNGLGHTTSYSNYNALGQPGRVTGVNGAVTDFTYDLRGRITLVSNIVGGVAQTTRYTYDGAGRLITVKTPDNVTSTREYDAANRVLREYQDEAGGTFAVKKYTYNNASQPTSVTVQRTTAVIGPVGTPTLSITSSSAGNYTVAWSGSSGVENYVLEEKLNSGSWSSSNEGPSTSTAFSGKAAGTYTYRVTGCNAEACTPVSAEKSIVVVYPPASAPVVTAPTADSDGAYTASWTSVSTTTEYRLEQRKDGGVWSQIYSGTGLSHAMSGLTNGTYDYQARACNAGGCSAYSAIKTTVVTFPPTGVPTLTVPATDNDGAFTVSWTGVSAATRYELQQRKDSGTWSVVYNSSGLSLGVSGLANGNYEYVVRACNVGGCAAFTASKATLVTHPPGTPTVTAPTADNDGAFAVSWGGISTATNYRLEQRKDGGTWSQIYSGTGLSKAMAGLTNGTYDYQARACNAGGCSAYSAIKTTVVTLPPGAPTVTAPTSDNDGAFTASWTSVSTTTEYRLEQRKDGGIWSQIYSGTGLSKAMSALTNGTYDYQVRACNAGGCSAYSSIKTTVVTFPPTGVPTLTVPATDNDGAFTVSWTGVSAATRYELQQRKDSGPWGTVYNSSGLSKAVSGLTNGSYEYQVRACNVGGCAAFSAIKATAVTYPPGTPTVTAPTADSDGAFAVSWGGVSTATSYRLIQRKDGGAWSQVYSGTGLSHSLSGLTNGTYDYQAQACNAGGCSAYSAIKATVVTHPPNSPPTLTAPMSSGTYTSFNVSWTSVSTATRYELQMAYNGGVWETVYNGTATYVSQSHRFDGKYSYRGRACNVGGCGPFSATVIVRVAGSGGGGGTQPFSDGPVGEEI